MDAFAHLNNTVYFRYFESARIAYFERMAILTENNTPQSIGPILASTSCRFKAPIFYPDTVQSCTRVLEVGEDRFSMEHVIFSQKLGKLAAKGEGLIVAYDYSNARKASVPREWKRRIEHIEGWN